MCAGMGERMRPLTNDKPKPMVEIWGKPLIDHILGDFQKHGIENAVLNTHYKADVLEKHLKDHKNPAVTISHEEILLNTGGGLKNALHHFDDREFFVINGDAFFEHSAPKTAFTQMQDYWDPDSMDILILLEPVGKMSITQGVGDYDLDKDGKAIRSKDKSGKYMFTSLRINTARIFDHAPDTAFNYRDLMDEAQAKGRLYGIVHDGLWHHISTPEDVKNVNDYLLHRRKRA